MDGLFLLYILAVVFGCIINNLLADQCASGDAGR